MSGRGTHSRISQRRRRAWPSSKSYSGVPADLGALVSLSSTIYLVASAFLELSSTSASVTKTVRGHNAVTQAHEGRPPSGVPTTTAFQGLLILLTSAWPSSMSLFTLPALASGSRLRRHRARPRRSARRRADAGVDALRPVCWRQRGDERPGRRRTPGRRPRSL